MVEKKALGKGLKALIGEPEEFARYDRSTQNYIMIDNIEPNPFQPREDFDEEKLADLAASIKRNGVLQPIILRKVADKYQIVAGERRWRAAQKAQLMSIPAIVRDATDEDMLTLALIENLQRQDLNPIEEATAYQDLIERYELTQDSLAIYIGKNRSTIANTIRLLGLPQDVQAHVSRGTLSMGHARALLALPTPEAQREVCRRVLEDGLSVRQVENLIKAGLRARSRRIRHMDTKTDPDIRRLEEDLQRSLGAKVRIRTSGKRGSIQIEFYSPEELEGLIDRLLGGDV